MPKPKHHHSDRDRIFTPEPIAIRLIKKVPAISSDSWCDPCYGNGVFFKNFPTQNKVFYEIDMGRDFLLDSKQYDWHVTNIPFSQPKEFIFSMAARSKKGFGILCLANSMTATRLAELERQDFHINSITILYIKSWGFGYRTDFYVFTRNSSLNIETIIY